MSQKIFKKDFNGFESTQKIHSKDIVLKICVDFAFWEVFTSLMKKPKRDISLFKHSNDKGWSRGSNLSIKNDLYGQKKFQRRKYNSSWKSGIKWGGENKKKNHA